MTIYDGEIFNFVESNLPKR